MPNARSTRFRFVFIATLLVGMSVALSGCIYLRLLQLKGQLKEFEKYFKLDTTTGVRIQLLSPLLLGDDLRWLGVEPKTIETKGENSEHWEVVWIKEVPPGVKETAVYDVQLSADFVDDRLTSVFIDDRFFAYFSKDLFVNLVRSTGEAKIDRGSRQAEVAAAGGEQFADHLPNERSIGQMLGIPSEKLSQSGEETYRYRYSPVTPTGKGKAIGVTFVFDSTTGKLKKLTGKLPTGSLHFDFAQPTPLSAGKPQP